MTAFAMFQAHGLDGFADLFAKVAASIFLCGSGELGNNLHFPPMGILINYVIKSKKVQLFRQHFSGRLKPYIFDCITNFDKKQPENRT